MLLLMVISLAFLVATNARPKDDTLPTKAYIKHYENTREADTYAFGFESSDGIKRDERGFHVDSGTGDQELVVMGSYEYTDPDGKLVEVHYLADGEGFRIVGRPQLTQIPVISSAAIASLAGGGLG